MSGFAILCAAAGVSAAMPVSYWVMRRMRASKSLRTGAALAALLLSSFAYFEGRDTAAIEESKDETGRKKDAQSGDPPVPEGEAERE